MSKRPVSLAKARLAPVPEVVEIFTDALRRAKAGEIRGVAIAASCDGRAEMGVHRIGDGGVATLNLALDRCKERLLREGEE